MGVALIDVVKAFAPLPTIFLSILFERDARGMPLRYPRSVLVALCIVVAGTAMAVYDVSTSSSLGYFLAVVATLSMAMLAVTTAVFVNMKGGGFNAINLVWYGSCLAMPVLAIFFGISQEYKHVFTAIAAEPSNFGWATVSAVTNFFLQILAVVVVERSSALTSTVANNSKRVIMILLACVAANNGLPNLNYVGVGIFVLGASAYAYVMYQRRFQAPMAPPPLEAGMAQFNKGKTEDTALLDAAPAAPTCCVVC